MHDLDDFDILVLPGWHGSNEAHWQTQWQRGFPAMRRVEQEDWEEPVYAQWARRLSADVIRCRKPVIFVAHSLGTSLVMRWASENRGAPVAGAFLVAPSDRDRFEVAGQYPSGFAPMILEPLGFPAMVLASRDDPRVTFERAGAFARAWGATLVDVGERGHIGSAERLGLWPQGLVWFGQFVGSLHRPTTTSTSPEPACRP